MKIGSIGYSHARGLGHLLKDFYDNGVVTDVLVVEHPTIPVQEWYPNAPRTALRSPGPDVELLKSFCRTVEAVIFFETPFVQSILPFCRDIGVRTYLVTMYECTPIHREHPYKYLCPSLLDVKYFQQWNHQYLPLPVDRKKVRWKERTTAHHFIHNGGYLGLKGKDGVQREGTEVVIRAMQHVRSPLQLTIRVQENPAPALVQMAAADSRIRYLPENVPFDQLYSDGDVAVGAQKWNGCSLPLQEAYASGLLVMNTYRYPMTEWLPTDPLVLPRLTIQDSSIGGPYLKFEESCVDPVDLARKMDEWYGRDIMGYSQLGKRWGDEHSWENLKPLWLEALSK